MKTPEQLQTDMSTTYNLTLTTAEAYTLKNFITLNTRHLRNQLHLSNDDRTIAFIADRLPDVTPGQQTFPSEQTPPTPEQELFRLCLDIILTSPITKVEKYTGSFNSSYTIYDSEKDEILYINRSCGPAPLREFYYTASLYTSNIHISENFIKELFNQIQTRYKEAKDKQAEEEKQKIHKILQDNIQKAKQHLESLNSNS